MKRAKKNSRLSETWRRFKKNKPAVLGLIVICIFILACLFAGFIVDYDAATTGNGQDRLIKPCAEHIFGTDQVGRDLFARVLYGGRISLSVGLIAVGISITFGSLLGASTAYLGGLYDGIVMRIMDILNCIPSTLLCMAIVTSLGPGIVNMMFAICIAATPSVTRLVRSNVLSLTEMEYNYAAKAFGGNSFHIIVRHVLPNAFGLIIIQAASMVAATILTAAGLSFLGFGAQPPDPEWGAILSDAKGFMREAPYMMIFPGLAIVISSMSITLIGDGLRDALDPRLKD